MVNQEQLSKVPAERPTVCFLNPAWMPEWFWLPTANALSDTIDYRIPRLIRDDMAVDIEMNVDHIQDTMQDIEAQYIVALSRGIEYAVRFIDRMTNQGRRSQLLGCMVISSVGPKGYENMLTDVHKGKNRHTAEYMAGISLNASGLEVLDEDCARTVILHDVQDKRLNNQIMTDMCEGRPLSDDEVAMVPNGMQNSIPFTWYIGNYDKVDDRSVSTAIAQQIFRVNPVYTEWGHVGPLTHTDQVASRIQAEIESLIIEKEQVG